MAIGISYCPGLINGKYCPLREICYRCNACEQSRQLEKYGKRNEGFAQFDLETKTCPFYLNKAQWIVIKMLAK